MDLLTEMRNSAFAYHKNLGKEFFETLDFEMLLCYVHPSDRADYEKRNRYK